MKILFFMRYYSYIAHYEESLRLLAAKGHRIHFAFDNRHRKPFDPARMAALFDIPEASYDFFPDTARSGFWGPLADLLRRIVDYLRYFHPDYRRATKLRRRAERRIPAYVRTVVREGLLRLSPSDFWIRSLARLERCIPTHPAAKAYLSAHRPDVVLFTPLVDSNAGFVDFAKAARRLGVPSANCVASWDNLTNKGLIQAPTDAVIVWNDFQRAEAVKYHGIETRKVITTGAQTFDKWFARRPTLSADEFMRKIGLEGRARLIVYACSSRFIAREEPSFIRRWLEGALRRSTLANAGFLVRPHPANLHDWDAHRLEVPGRVRVFPRWRGIPYPFTEEDREDYFHTLYYASAVVGVNTSAMIEAGIQGAPVFTIVTEDFRETQDGTLHFDHIRSNGLLTTAPSVERHLDQLEEALDGRRDARADVRRFVDRFVRPHGREVPCSPIVAEAIERLRDRPADPADRRPSDPVVRALLAPFALAALAAKRVPTARSSKKGRSRGLPNNEGASVDR